MKRKIITKKQLDRLVSLGVVVLGKDRDYHSVIDRSVLFPGSMFDDLIGCSVEVIEKIKTGIIRFWQKIIMSGIFLRSFLHVTTRKCLQRQKRCKNER